MPGAPYISIVIPVFNEAENIPVLYKQLVDVLSAYGRPYELIFVDDGSTDDTVKALSAINEHVIIERFEHNRGKSDALTRGFSMAGGDVVITMDGDLQDDPGEIPRFVEALKRYDVVSGWRHNRRDPLSKTAPSRIYNILTGILTGVRLHDLNCGYKAYRHEVLDGLKLSGGMHRYILVLIIKKGYRVGEIKVAHRPRLHGKSKYGMLRLLAGLADLIKIRFFGE